MSLLESNLWFCSKSSIDSMWISCYIGRGLEKRMTFLRIFYTCHFMNQIGNGVSFTHAIIIDKIYHMFYKIFF